MAAPVHLVVASPLQLLNGHEALARLDLESDSRVTALVTGDDRSQAQFHRVLEHTGLADRTELLRAPSTATKWRWLRRESARDVSTLIIGEYRLALLRELAARLEPDRLVLVDDGSATLLVHAHREGLASQSLRLSGAKAPVRERLQRLIGVTGPDPARITYVTIYELQSDRDEIIRHCYEQLRSSVVSDTSDAPPAILGSALVESGIMDQDAYVELVRQALDHPDPALVYHPHRRESPHLLASIERLGLRVEQLAGPAELELRLRPLPRRIDALPSTVVHTLPCALGEGVRLRMLVPEPESISIEARHGLDLLISYTRSRRSGMVEVLEL